MGNSLAALAECLSSDKRELKISRCYSINPDNWLLFFRQHVNPSSVTTFDASHVYWLPADLLCSYIMQMNNLEELCVQDTQINLTHLARIYEACPKLVKLSFSLLEDNFDCYDSDGVLEEATLSQGFAKLTHLKIYTFSLDKKCCVESWLVTFGVLKWCGNCQHLLIEVCHSSNHYDPHYVKTFKHHGLPNQRSQKVITIAEKKLFPRLGWMRYLKSLIILKHDYGNSHPDLVLKHFSSWLLKEGIKSSWPSLDRLWIENKTRPPRTLPTNFMNEQLFKSLMGKDGDKEPLLEGQYRFVEHTALAKLDRNLRIGDLPALKYLRGSVMDVKWFQQFCQLHPLLEELHLDNESKDIDIFDGNWQLLALKVLVYEVYSDPSERIQHQFPRMMEACPHILELHLNVNLSKEDSPNFFDSIQFQNLTWLTIHNVSFPANYSLPTIDVDKCPQLQHLHLKGDFVPGHLFNLSKRQLPFATKLRDLRLEWNESCVEQFLFVLRYCRKTLPNLERLVLVNSSGSLCHPSYSGLEDLLIAFVEKMPELVALCLVGFQIDPITINVLSRRLTEEIIRPLRPSLWFHIGQKLPTANDPSAPRIHFDEIVNPLDKFYTPPHFF